MIEKESAEVVIDDVYGSDAQRWADANMNAMAEAGMFDEQRVKNAQANKDSKPT